MNGFSWVSQHLGHLQMLVVPTTDELPDDAVVTGIGDN